MSAAMLVCAPLRIEARALRAGLDRRTVLRTGCGPARSARSAAFLAAGEDTDTAMVVAGLGGGLAPGFRSGDVVVGDELRDRDGTIHRRIIHCGHIDSDVIRCGHYRCGHVSSLVDLLRQEGLRVHRGPIASADHVVLGTERAALARDGALAVDMESAELARGAHDRPLAVVRVLLDTPGEPLIGAGLPGRLHRALHVLRLLGVPLDRWSRAVHGYETTTSVHTGEDL